MYVSIFAIMLALSGALSAGDLWLSIDKKTNKLNVSLVHNDSLSGKKVPTFLLSWEQKSKAGGKGGAEGGWMARRDTLLTYKSSTKITNGVLYRFQIRVDRNDLFPRRYFVRAIDSIFFVDTNFVFVDSQHSSP